MRNAAYAFLTASVIASSCGAVPAHAGEDVYLGRFVGSWSGAGTVQKNSMTSPWRVSCQATGNIGADSIVVRGTCRAAIIMSRDFSADLTFDAKSGRYTGIYTGAKVGPARLSGKRVGDRVDLAITWPKPVNGDTSARMTIFNTGKGTLQIVIADNLSPGGPVELTSNIQFRHG